MITEQTIKRGDWTTQTNYFVTREDYRKININLNQNITGKQINMTVRVGYDTSILLSKTATITDAPNGLAEIVLTKSTTPLVDDYANLNPGKYIYDIQLKTISSDGDRNTFQSWTITILDHVTTT